MKRTNLRRFLPILLTLLTVVVFALGITAMANEEETRSNQITHANLVLDNDVDLVFWADITEDDAQNANTVMVFNDSVTVSYSGTRTLNDVTYAIFRYNNILPQDLSDVVNAKLYVNGVLTSYIDYSVKNYCQYVLTNTTNESLKALISDLLVYGAESQGFVGEASDSFVTNGVVGLTPSQSPEKMTVLYNQEIADDLSRGATAALLDSKLVMDNGIELHFNVDLPKDADPADYTVCLSVNGREQEVPIISKVTVTGYSNRVTFKGIYSYELFDIIQVNVYKNNVRVSNSMSFSVASYIDALNKDPNYTAVTAAYYNYCYSSHIYAGTHTVVMPGEIVGANRGNDRYNDDGTITYKCSLCGHDVSSIKATHIRNFEGMLGYGSIANTGNYTAGDGTTKTSDLITMSNGSESLEDGTTNGFLSLVRDTASNIATGNFGYYITYDAARPSVVSGTVDNKRQYTASQFTFTFDVKAPKAGLADVSLYLRNTNLSSGTGRYGEILTISSNGSISRSSTKIAPAGTIGADEWSTITVTMDFYTKDGGNYIYLEYYVGSELMNSLSIANAMHNYKFTDIYLSIPTAALSNGKGVYIDNLAFAQGCVHSFTDSVADYVTKIGEGNIRSLIDSIQNDFDVEDFSYVVRWDGKSSYTTKEYQSFVTLDRNKYQDPDVTPKSYDHPRLLFNSNDIPDIVKNIEDESNALAKSSFLSLVNTYTDGKLTPTSEIAPQSFEWTNYNTTILRVIEAKALYYALYKDSATVSPEDARLRGYEAIYAMKNYILTFDVQWKASDQCRYYGDIMYYTALVYDWCYDLLTNDDKDQFRLGVQNLLCDGTNNMPWAKREGATGTQNGVALNTHEARKLEGGFPALAIEQQSPLTGHGAEAQVIRDYFSFAIAIFDEDSSWYDYVGGLIYQEYVEPRNYFYESGFYPDGSGGYCEYRFLCDMYNAWLFKGMGVELPYVEENMASVVHGLVSMETYNGYMFATGDGAGTSWNGGQYRLPDNIGDAAIISAYIFDDPTALSIAHYILDYRWNQPSFSNSQLGISAGYYLILTSNGLTPSEDYREEIDQVEYHGTYQQQVVSRNGYEEDSVVVLMQGAQHLPGGHTHQNAGNFQIWYKGMLTRDDGLYDAYGSDHHHYYHMSATAHNTLLIFNPDKKDNPTEAVGRTGFYNGGQRHYLDIGKTKDGYDLWVNNERFSYGKLIGMQTDDEENPTYVYFANDLTSAYEEDTVDYVERSTMTVYTGDAETPMVMFIFDNITSDREDFRKTFLLQCATEPIVNKENGTVTVDNGEGKLVLTSLLNANEIKAYGRTSVNGEVGEGIKGDGSERFYLSGQEKSVFPGGASSIGDKNTDLSLIWGHIEVNAPTDNTTHQLMNVLYVADSGTDVTATPRLIEGANVTGATFKNYTSVFVNDPMNIANLLSFTAEADDGVETMTYYVNGLSMGEWKVFIGGNQIFSGTDDEGNGLNFNVTEDGRMLTFEGPVGEVTIEPGENMRPAGSVGIAYNLNGGKWEGEAPEAYYIKGEVTVLPIPVKQGSTFVGWFTEKEFVNQITEIPADATTAYRLYAKWSTPILHVDYTMGGSLSQYSSATYSPESSGSNWEITTSGKETYLLWTTTGTGGIIGKAGAYGTYASQSYQISFTISLGRNESDPLIPLQLYARDDAHGRHYSNIFMTDVSGNAYLGNGGYKVKIGTLASSGMTSFRFVLDFEKGKVTAYDENGAVIVTKDMQSLGISLPSGCTSYKSWYESMKVGSSSMMSLKGGGAGSIRVYGISMLAGSITGSCKHFGPQSTLHKWDEGVMTSAPSATDCTPGAMVYTCTECELTKTVALTSDNPHATMTQSITSNNKLEYACGVCGCTYIPAVSTYLDGSSYDGIVGVGNASNFDTKDGTNQPKINAGAYELINKTGNSGNMELWVPGRTPTASGFSSTENAIGFISFKVNALTTDAYSFNLVDTSSGGAKWTSDWCITDSFFRIFAPTTVGGKTTVKITGWDSLELANIQIASAQNFTDWIDVKIYVQFNAETDEIMLSYYIDGEYKGTVSRELTTSTNAINSFCITGSTSSKGSGIKLDDVAFGYTANGAWEMAAD